MSRRLTKTFDSNERRKKTAQPHAEQRQSLYGGSLNPKWRMERPLGRLFPSDTTLQCVRRKVLKKSYSVALSFSVGSHADTIERDSESLDNSDK